MKKLFNKILCIFFMIFSLFSFVFAEVNPAYTKYENLSDTEKSKYGLVPDEFISYYDIKPSSIFTYKRSYKANNILPSVYDLRDVNSSRLITEVKNQNPLGLCWAFSTNSMLESYHLVDSGEYYNFSENAPDYQAQYYGDSASSNGGNSLENAVKYWFLGNGPVTEKHFGSYFTNSVEKNKFDFLDSSNAAVDVLGVTFFKALDMYELKKKYTGTNIKNIVTEYNNTIKNHIMDNGAVAAGIYMDYMNYNSNFLYNPDYAGAGNAAHAITIIGWDDNFGSVTINGTTLKGSWIAMNSWGESSYPYFYISYYDADVVTNMVGTTNSRAKSWDNAYFHTNSLSSSFDYNSNSVTYVINKGSSTESLKSVKVYYRYSSDVKLNITVSDGVNSYDLGEKTFSKGLYNFDISDGFLTSEQIYITLSGEGLLSVYPYVYVGVYTNSFENDSSLELYGKNSNSFQNSTDNTLHFNVITKNIDSATNYNVKIYDTNNNDVTSSFDVSIKKELVNGHSYFTLKQNSKITGNMISVKANILTLNDTINYYIQGNGTVNNPYILSSSSDMYLIRNYRNSYFKLGNDIDMYYDTNNSNGKYYNNGNGWIGEIFSGTLDGNGYKISGMFSLEGGLFSDITDATIKDLQLDNVSIVSSNDSGLLGHSLSGSSVISNIYISNSNAINNADSGALFGSIYGGTIKNIHVKTGAFYSQGFVGGIAGNVINPESNITISNVFIDDTLVYSSNGGVPGQIIGNVQIDPGLTNKLIIQYSRINIPNFAGNTNPTSIFGKSKYSSSSVTLTDNITLSDEDKLIKSNFNNYDFNNIWGYDTSVYLKLFNNESISKPIPEIDVIFNKYLIKDDIVYNIIPSTTRNQFISNMIIDEDLTYKIYNISGKILSGDELVGTGSYIIISNGVKTKTYDIAVYGDVSGDGKVSIKDVYLIADYAIANSETKGLILSSDVQLLAADVNKDGKISITDVFRVADFAINPSKGF